MGPEKGRSSFTLAWVLMVRAHKFIANQITLTRNSSVHTREIFEKLPAQSPSTNWMKKRILVWQPAAQQLGTVGLAACAGIWSVSLSLETGSSPARSRLHVLGASSEFRWSIEETFFPFIEVNIYQTAKNIVILRLGELSKILIYTFPINTISSKVSTSVISRT